MDKHYNQEGRLEVLVAWRGLPKHEGSWILVQDFKQ